MAIKDLVQGEVRVKNSELDDLVMLRGDGTPTYMLAAVVDDFDMNITHVIRGDDHLTNAFRQKVIYEAMQWRVPEFAHIPLIHALDGSKMSKRHGATSVIEYKNMGYLPEALRNYLLRLGFGMGEEIISDMDAAKIFDIAKVGKSPSRFDFLKLNHVNKHYIKEKSDAELLTLLAEFWDKKISKDEELRIVKALKFLKEKPDTISEIANAARVYFDNFSVKIDEDSIKILEEKKLLLSDLLTVFKNLQNWNHDEIKNAINEYAALKAIKIKDFGPALRIALTFSGASAGGIFDVVEFLGKAEVVSRLQKCL
jgi:glutamyl-tRNA synthetase